MRQTARSGVRGLPPGGNLAIEIVNRQRAVRIDRAWLAGVLGRALAAEGVARATVCVVLVDDRRMASLHRRWLGLPGPTDVITFDLGDGDRLCGDIACSTETALREAARYGWSARHELAYYMIHGLLHLTGYDDHAVARRGLIEQAGQVGLEFLDVDGPHGSILLRPDMV